MNKIGILHLSDIHISEDSIPDIDILIKKLINLYYSPNNSVAA